MPLPPVNHLYFQQHSGFKGLSTFVFIDIPALAPSFPQWSFVFIEIPASVHQLRNPFLFPLQRQASCLWHDEPICAGFSSHLARSREWVGAGSSIAAQRSQQAASCGLASIYDPSLSCCACQETGSLFRSARGWRIHFKRRAKRRLLESQKPTTRIKRRRRENSGLHSKTCLERCLRRRSVVCYGLAGNRNRESRLTLLRVIFWNRGESFSFGCSR